MDQTRALEATKIALETGINLMLWGESGIGKSSIVRQAAEEFKHELYSSPNRSYLFNTNEQVQNEIENQVFDVFVEDVRCAQAPIEEWGIPIIFAECRNEETGELVRIPKELVGQVKGLSLPEGYIHDHTRPRWWHRADAPGMHIVFFDELNRGDKWAMNAIMQVCAENKLRSYDSPGCFRLLSANNPPTDDFIVEDTGGAMNARWSHVLMHGTKSRFLENRSQYLDSVSLHTLKANDLTEIVPSRDNTDWSPTSNVVVPSSRGWEKAALLGRYIEWHKANGHLSDSKLSIIFDILGGTIGTSNAKAWETTYRSGFMVNVDDLLAGKIDKKEVQKVSDALHTIAFILAYNLKDIHLVSPENRVAGRAKASSDRLAALIDWILFLKEEIPDSAAVILTNVLNSDPGSKRSKEVKNISTMLLQKKELSSWASQILTNY